MDDTSTNSRPEDRPRAERALAHAEALGFTMSSNPEVGRLLAVLAAAVPHGGRILEIGTGTGVGTASLVSGLGSRTDATVDTIELDADTGERARDNDWPDHVRFHVGDAVELLPTLGAFDLIYADAPGGKWHGLDRTLAALAPRGVLLVDDMAPQDWWSAEHREHQARVREQLVSAPFLAVCELDAVGGLILGTRRD
ncbi:class I SAM-dependent methyltransferase [Streptomycetaceae bacterium NBC_01309]